MSVPEFKTEKVSDRITRIYAFSSELMYLVEGSEKAALLDSGSGIGFVRPLIEQLTEKEVIVLLTHGHVVHAKQLLQTVCKKRLGKSKQL